MDVRLTVWFACDDVHSSVVSDSPDRLSRNGLLVSHGRTESSADCNIPSKLQFQEDADSLEPFQHKHTSGFYFPRTK